MRRVQYVLISVICAAAGAGVDVWRGARGVRAREARGLRVTRHERLFPLAQLQAEALSYDLINESA